MVKKLLIPIILAIALICSISLIIWNPFSTHSSSVIENAIVKLSELKNFKADGRIFAKIWTKPKTEGEEAQIISGSLLISEVFSDLGTEKAKTSSDIELEIGIEGITIGLAGKIVGVKNELYFKITTLPSIPFLGEGLDEFKNQWIKVDTASLREKISQAPIEETIGQEEFINDLIELIKGKKFFKVKKKFSTEELDGIKVNRYLTELDKNIMRELIPEILELNKKYLSEEEKINYEKELKDFSENFEKNFDNIWDKIKPLNFEFWLREKDLSLYRIKFEKEISSDFFEMEEIDKIELSIDFDFSDFNKKVDIEIPEDAISIEEIFPFIIPENFPVE